MRFSNSFVIFLIFSLVAEIVSSSSHQTDDCQLTKIFTCAAKFGVRMTECLENLDILKCLEDIIGVTNKCYKCAMEIACNACKPGNYISTECMRLGNNTQSLVIFSDDCPLTKFFTCGAEFGVRMANCIGKLKSDILACVKDIVPLGNKCYPCAIGIACNACKLGQPLATTLQTCRVG